MKIGVAYYRHHYPIVTRIKQLVASGEIGKVNVAQINAFEVQYFKSDDPKCWKYLRKHAGGGPMMGAGCHRLEVMLHLLGPVKNVHSRLESCVVERDVEDNTTALLLV